MANTDDEGAHRRLYAAVIIQGLIDATLKPRTMRDQIVRDQARAWFDASVGTTAQDFEAVCAAADVAPSRVRTFIRDYDGPPLTLHTLARMRNQILDGSDE